MNKLTQERLKEILYYNPETGIFTRLVSTSNSHKIGDIAGGLTSKGYTAIRVDGKRYQAHRLAWLYVHGYFPEHQIDHKFGNRSDNRISQIKEATQVCNSQNCKLSSNNTSEFTGVGWDKYKNKWRAYIRIHGKLIFLGLFEDKISAALARVAYEDGSPDWTCNHQQVNRVKLRELGYRV